MFTRNFLEGWWQRALRRRVLYTALDREDRGYLPFYAFVCPEHGLVEDYPSGYTGRLKCPKCGSAHCQH